MQRGEFWGSCQRTYRLQDVRLSHYRSLSLSFSLALSIPFCLSLKAGIVFVGKFAGDEPVFANMKIVDLTPLHASACMQKFAKHYALGAHENVRYIYESYKLISPAFL